MSYLEEPNLPSTLELDHDAFSFSNLEECFPSDDKGMADGYADGTGQLNFGFAADAIANNDHFLPLGLGPQYNGSLGFPIDGQGISVGHPIDIPNFGGQHRSGNFPLTPPDSDGPDSPDVDQVLLRGLPGTHNVVLSSSSHSGGLYLQQGIPFNNSGDFQSQLSLSSVSEPTRKRKRDSECSESLTANSMSSLRLNSLKSEPDDYCVDGSGSDCLDSPDPFTTPATPDPENSYQCLKWSSFKSDECCSMFDDASQKLPPPQFRVDADKGFNYSFADEAFVCQKKNHLQGELYVCYFDHSLASKQWKGTWSSGTQQVTAYMNLQSSQLPKYVQGEQNELRHIDKFCLHLYGIKMESQASQIGVEQSQADRSKRRYEPLQFDITPKEQAKITVGRLHFSETTANNMRKKGKPNPDQRYFLLVVAVYAHTKNKEYLVCANVSERIIVRASNPGQFENDMEAVWSRGQTSDSVFRMGRVGVNTDKPEEALSVYGNVKVTGRLVYPSDIRIKESIVEVDTSEQLRNVSKMKLYKYRYSREYREHAGLDTSDCEGEDTGVLAQEVKEVLPEAVKESEDLVLADGKTIERFLVVNKERIFMENVGAVKELCKLTDNLEVRIDELETVNQKLQRRRCDTVSTFSSLSLSRCSSFRASINSNKQSQERRKKYHHHHHCHHHHHHCACRHHAVVYEEQGWCSPKFMQFLIVTLVFFMVVSIAGMATIYILQDKDDESSGDLNRQRLSGLGLGIGKNGSNLPSLTTNQPTISVVQSITTTVKPFKSRTSVSRSGPLPTDLQRSQSTGTKPLYSVARSETTSKTVANRSLPATLQTTSKLSKPSEPTPVSEGKTRTPKSDQCCNQKNREYPSKLLQGKEVYDDKPSISLPSTKLHDPELRILENNYVITYSNKSSHNSSHYIPFSPDLPFQPITLEINSTASSLVLLCSTSHKYDCPEKNTHPLYDTTKKHDSWMKCHRWQLPVAFYYKSTYHFRLVLSPTIGNVTCNTLSQPNGPRLQDLYFNFIRKCNT